MSDKRPLLLILLLPVFRFDMVYQGIEEKNAMFWDGLKH